jgi:hypothetical protein
MLFPFVGFGNILKDWKALLFVLKVEVWLPKSSKVFARIYYACGA